MAKEKLEIGNTGSMVVRSTKKPRRANKPKTSAPKGGK